MTHLADNGDAEHDSTPARPPLRPAHQVMLTAYISCRSHLNSLNEQHIEISRNLDRVIELSTAVRAEYDDLYAALTEAGVDPDSED